MFELHSFFDYCISEQCILNDNYEKTIRTLYDYGYRTIAINQLIVEGEEPKKKKKKGESREIDDIPAPHDLKTVKGCESLKILNRLTIVFSNQETLHKIIQSPNYKKYHIKAVLPTSDPALMYVSNVFEADIICFNYESKLSVRYNRKIYNHLVERGYFFEILYAPAIEDSTQRKNIIQVAHLYHSIGKLKNIIVSSGASNPILIRSPYDVINLGLIFGLNKQQAKSAITHCGRQVYLNSVGRKHGKAVMFVENIEKESEIMEVISLLDTTDDCIEAIQPAMKKIKQ